MTDMDDMEDRDRVDALIERLWNADLSTPEQSLCSADEFELLHMLDTRTHRFFNQQPHWIQWVPTYHDLLKASEHERATQSAVPDLFQDKYLNARDPFGWHALLLGLYFRVAATLSDPHDHHHKDLQKDCVAKARSFYCRSVFTGQPYAWIALAHHYMQFGSSSRVPSDDERALALLFEMARKDPHTISCHTFLNTHYKHSKYSDYDSTIRLKVLGYEPVYRTDEALIPLRLQNFHGAIAMASFLAAKHTKLGNNRLLQLQFLFKAARFGFSTALMLLDTLFAHKPMNHHLANSSDGQNSDHENNSNFDHHLTFKDISLSIPTILMDRHQKVWTFTAIEHEMLMSWQREIDMQEKVDRVCIVRSLDLMTGLHNLIVDYMESE